MTDVVQVQIGGEIVPVVVEGGNFSAGASVATQDLNAAVEQATKAANDAQAAADAANTAYENTVVLLPGKVSKIDMPLNARDFGAVGDGVTNDTAAIQNAVISARLQGRALFLPRGDYKVSSITVGSGLYIYGEGATLSVLKQRAKVFAAILNASDATDKANIKIEGIGFDTNFFDAGVYLTNISDLTIKDCEFRNHPFWGIHVGIDEARAPTSSLMTCRNILIEGCRFFDTTTTYEHIALFNGENMTVTGCTFTGAMDGGIGIGLYQHLRGIAISDCQFYDITKGAYYSITCNDITFSNCSFKGCTIGIQGANESDHGLFSEGWVYGLYINGCHFYENEWAVEIGAVRGGAISGCHFFRNTNNSLVFSYGNRLDTPNINQTVNFAVSHCHFLNNNQSGTNPLGHPGVLFNEGGGVMYVTFTDCTWEDSQMTPTQLNAVAFVGAFEWATVTFTNCRMSSYGGGLSVAVGSGATLDDVLLINCKDLSALPSGATQAVLT